MIRAIYAVKRAHWQCWKTSRRMLREARVTPARLDLLHCLERHGGSMLQGAVQRALGIVRSTASEALRKLEELGFVRRGPRGRNGRRVSLTAAALRVLADVYEIQMAADDRIVEPFGGYDGWGPRTIVLERLCRRLRVAFGDPSWGVLYEWLDYDW